MYVQYLRASRLSRVQNQIAHLIENYQSDVKEYRLLEQVLGVPKLLLYLIFTANKTVSDSYITIDHRYLYVYCFLSTYNSTCPDFVRIQNYMFMTRENVASTAYSLSYFLANHCAVSKVPLNIQ